MAVTGDGSLVQSSWSPPVANLRGLASPRTIKTGNLKVKVSADPIVFTIASERGATIQQMKLDKETGVLSFITGNSPLLGLGEGGPQFDRRGSTDRMVSGQGGDRLATHGGRGPIPWLFGNPGRALVISHPFGNLHFSGPAKRFISSPGGNEALANF